MNLSIEKNSRGSLEITDRAIKSLIFNELSNSTGKSYKNFSLDIDFYNDSYIYVLININMEAEEMKAQMSREKELIKVIENFFISILKNRPKNIAISYTKKEI